MTFAASSMSSEPWIGEVEGILATFDQIDDVSDLHREQIDLLREEFAAFQRAWNDGEITFDPQRFSELLTKCLDVRQAVDEERELEESFDEFAEYGRKGVEGGGRSPSAPREVGCVRS